MGLREFYTGNTQEKRVLASASRIERKRTPNERQQQVLDEALGIRRRLSRRKLLTEMGAASAAAVLIYTGYEVFTRESGYQGPVEGMRGVPMISSEQFAGAIEQLRLIDHPFIDKVVSGLSLLTEAEQNPSPDEFPSWAVQERTFPLPITYSTEGTVSRAHAESPGYDTKKGSFLFYENPDSSAEEAPYLTPHYMGIELNAGIDTQDKDTHEYIMATVLAKEFVTLMFHTAASKNANHYFMKRNSAFSHPNGTLLTDSQDINHAAFSMYSYRTHKRDRVEWAITDSFPILVMGGIINESRQNGGYYPVKNRTFSLSDGTAEYLKDTEVSGAIKSIIDQWTESTNLFLPPETVIAEVYDPTKPVFQTTKTLAEDLYDKSFQ